MTARMIVRLLALAAGLVLLGCAVRPITVDMPDVSGLARPEPGPRPVRHVLVLSSGGADGAFDPDEMRPLYDVGWGIGYERAWASAPPGE